MSGFNYQTLGLTLAGGTLTSSTGPATLTAPTYLLNGGVIDTSVTLGAGGVVTQASGLTKIFGNIATPSVTITGGTLQLEGNNVLTTGTQLTLTAGNLDLNGFKQSIATLTGGGNVLLSSNSSGGTFTVGSGAFSGSIQNGGTQPGNFVLAGPGLFILSGTNTYTGSTTINGGILEVDGAITSSSSILINAGGTLTGNGSVDPNTITIASGAVLSPGTAGTPGTSMTVAGNLVIQSGATYQVFISPTATTFANVTGTASLNGTVNAAFATGNYTVRTQYDILRSAGLNGTTFATITATNLPAALVPSLSYTNTDVLITLTAALGAGGGLNRNQQAVANTINNSFNSGVALPISLAGLFGLNGSALSNSLAATDGEAATGARFGAFKLMDQFLVLMLDPFVDGRSGSGWPSAGATAMGFAPDREASFPADIALAYNGILKAAPKPALDQRWSAWGASFGGSNRTNGDPVIGSNTVTASDVGFAGGMDYHFTRDTLAGFAVAGGGTNWNLAQALGGGRSDAFQAGLYGSSRLGPAYFAADLAFANYWITTNRLALGDQINARFNGQSVGGRIEAGYRYSPSLPSLASGGAGWGVGVTPYAALQVQSFHTPSYSEIDLAGGGLDLNVNAMNATDTRSELGARFDDMTMLNGRPLTLHARLAWAHDWVSNPSLVAAFQALPGSTFIVNGAVPSRDSALTSIGADLHLTSRWTITAKFDGEFGSRSQTYAGTGALRYAW